MSGRGSGSGNLHDGGKTTLFGAKLIELPETLDLVCAADHSPLAQALMESADRSVLAVGSGGSAVTAVFFARCRETLFGGLTKAVTPMELTLGSGDLGDADVWLFSAGANNPDFNAALHAARVRRARRIKLITRRADAEEALGLLGTGNVWVHVVPVANEKDSFLATHSLVSSIAALLVASNMASNDPIPGLAQTFRAAALAELYESKRRAAINQFAPLKSDDTLLIIADPQVAPVTTVLETSVWEASICSVQRTDFRNFAHGRHTWLHRQPHKTVLLALTGHDTEELWEHVLRLLPSQLRQISKSFGNCGRFRNAIGLIQGLVWIEAMGRAVGIDPGKPGIADFGRPLYKDDSLARLSKKLGPAVRQKRRAKLERDDPDCDNASIHAAARERLARLSAARIGGIVFDYDGTIVATDQRLAPPAEALMDELKRLHELGVRLAIATGRGGSAGEMLRQVLPPDIQPHILIGYYNGGYIKQLHADIRAEPPEEAPEITQTAAWLAKRSDLFSEPVGGEQSRVQISIQLKNIPDMDRFNREIVACESVASGAVRVTRSGHSLDFIPASSSKINVADRLAEGLAADKVVLRVGDQGARDGNDNEFLTHPYGISVKDVCGRDDGCWSFFGAHLTGPDALMRILKALKPDIYGGVRIDAEALGLDVGSRTGTNVEHGTQRF